MSGSSRTFCQIRRIRSRGEGPDDDFSGGREKVFGARRAWDHSLGFGSETMSMILL